MSERKYRTKEDVLHRGRQVIGIPFKLIDKTGRLKTGKGAVGTVMEESWFEYKVNNESKPDFEEAGVELKVTPYVNTTRGIRAKERLVCNIINYMEEYKHTFETSSFWTKCNTMLLMSYEHKKGIEKENYMVDEVVLFSFPTSDLLIIKKDWETIIKKIKDGKAHEISEGDTLYLAACTKGASAKSVREQPFSNIPAKQRAYSLKQSYMTYILNTYIFGNETDEHIIKDSSVLENVSFENYIIQKVTSYFGKSQLELMETFGLTTKAKNINELILARILGVSGKITATEEFKKANIVPKTIRVNQDGSITESMSFPTFNFIELSKETWETSTLKNYLAPTKFLFVIFEENEQDQFIFKRIKFWNMPNSDLEEVHKVWDKTVKTINDGVILQNVGKKTTNNLPKQSENRVAHVRPHGKNAADKLPLPDGRMMSKQCFWLNNSYIEEQIRE